MKLEASGQGRRGRSTWRWKCKVKENMEEKGLSENQVKGGSELKVVTRTSDP